MATSPITNFLNRVFRKLKTSTEIVSVVAVLIGLYIALEKLVDYTVEKKLNDEATLRKIAEQSRPSLIFDATTHIVSDMGATKYVKDIKVTKRLGNTTFPGMFDPSLPQHIEIDLNRHFGNPPILTALYDVVRIKAEPGKVFS